MVHLIKHDLEFILKQIKVAEAHAAGEADLATLVAGYNGNDGLTQAHLLPYGLRTVDGSYNNLLPGREKWGASDQSFPGLFDPTYLNDADGDRYDFNPLPGMESWYTNNDYANAGTRTGSQPGPGSGTVIDADPRIISNLIVDQTLNNPAAIAAALTHAGLSGPALMTALGEIIAARAALDSALAGAEAAEGAIAGLEADVTAAELALGAAEAAASLAAAQAAADQAAFESAEMQVEPAMGVRDTALAAYTALLIDMTPNGQQTAEIEAALAAFQAAQAEYELAQSNADALEGAAVASAAFSADAAALAVTAQATLADAQAALAEAQSVDADVAAATAALDGLLATHGVEMDGNTVYLPNVSPDEGLSSPFNGWMTIFGQFFDHGLDLVAKGQNGTVYVPLSPDDPLYVEGGQNYVPLTRVTVDAGADGILGTADDGAGPKNLTTPWVDQNQTYGSTASKQVFMREYVPGPDGKPIASGLLLEGSNGGLATWADIKAQARDVLGIELTDLNVGNIPLIAADPYGNFIPGPNGYPQLVVGMGPDGELGTADDVLREGNPAAPVSAEGVVLTGHAFLDDIAHAAVPIVTGGVLQADGDAALGYANADGTPGPQEQRGPAAYDNELLDRHFIAGDGRANENIALTAVHQVFHAEHNRVVEHTKDVTLQSTDRAFINEWLLVDLTDEQFQIVTGGDPAAMAALSEGLIWDGERLFQAGRFTNEMEYQHLVFEEFGRMMQPDIDAFMFEPSADINPSIAAEFAHVVYRFGHSMLRQDIAVIEMDADGRPVQNDIALFDGFLNPVKYDSLGSAEEASGAIIRGMSRQPGSAIDEFVTDVLRNQLLGIPLDLATINIARGRDVGTPPLNAGRQKFFEETGDTLLKPYESWADFALNMKNPASIINFIAAYGTHASLINTEASPKTIEQLRDAATRLVLGDNMLTGEDKVAFDNDRLDFLNAAGDYAGGTLGGLNTVDFWMGGLAEKKMAFGGMLGSTFSFVFQMTMENLQDADRFYYLSRTQGLNLLNELENNTFAELVMRNTDLGNADSTVLPGNLFSAFEMPTLEMDSSKQLGADPVSDDPHLAGFSQLVQRVDANGDGVAESIRVNSNEHFTIGGTEGNDRIVSGGGDDAIWGRGGDDTIEAGYGVDKVFGGAGDDIITNAGTDIGEADFLHGNEGNDVIHGGSGLSLIFGNQGNDFIVTGPDGKEAFGGTGNDFILGGSGGDFLLGNEGDDWIEGGQRFDTLAGENSELFFNSSIIGHDVLNAGSGDGDYDAESGDDVMFQNEGIQRSNGMAGFDWGIHKGDVHAAVSDLGIPAFATQEAFILRDRFDLVEGLSGWQHDDTLTGRREAVNTRAEATGTAAVPGPDSALDSYSNALLEKNVDRIDGLRELVAHIERTTQTGMNGVIEQVVMDTADASDIVLGGGGSDRIKGLAGNDVIDGDKWLNVRIAVHAEGGPTGAVIATADGMTGRLYRTAAGLAAEDPADLYNPAGGTNPPGYGGLTLQEAMFTRTFNAGQLNIVREIVDGREAGDIDTAVYTGARGTYSFGLNDDESLFVDHTGFVRPQQDDDVDEDEAVPNALSDGRDTIRGIEKLEFTDGVLNVIEGTAASEGLGGTAQDDLIVGRSGNDTLNGLGGNDILLGGSGNDTLNGGAGDDTYVFGPADGNDVINETSGNDRIIVAGGPLTAVNGFEVTNGGGNDNLVIQFNGQQVTVTDHFDQSGESVEFINLDGSTFEGYEFDGDYVLGTDDNGTRTAGEDNTLLAGTTGGDDMLGGDGDDLIFGHDGNDDLEGGDGDDLLVGGAGTDELIGGLGADTMVGGSGNDLYVVDDEDDAVVEAAGGGTDEVETDLDSYTLSANVEDLTYTGTGTFAGTGNELGNRITGGAGADTLSGLGGNDIYVVTAGDDVVEAAGGGSDTIESDASYTLASNLENLTLTGTGNTSGTGNGEANTITGNSGSNQLFGGAGNDSINGGAGNDLIDGGTGNDTLNGGSGDNIIIGGAGDDTIILATGNGNDDILRYTAAGFGADVVSNFDANASQGQDRIDLSGLGITAGNFAARVLIQDIEDGAVDDTLITVRDASGATMGTIRLEEVEATGANGVSAADFTLAAAPPPAFGNPTNGANTINGNGAANTINGLGGNDTLNGGGGNDVIDGGEGADTLNGGDGDDTLTGGRGSDVGTAADNFGSPSYGNNNGAIAFAGNWTEGGGETTSPTGGDITINGGRLQFSQSVDGGETIQRAVNLAGATAATLTFAYEDDNLGAGQSVIVEAWNIVTSTWQALPGGTLGSTTGNGNGTFTANLTANQIGATSAIRLRTTGDGNNWDNGDNFYVDNFAINLTQPGLNAGVDTVNGDAGDDTIVWNANATGATDGRDLVNGGTEGTGGDTLVINGNASAETYRIYTRSEALAAGMTGIGTGTEIVVTRNGTGNDAIIAELSEIEEIRINGFDPAGASGTAGNDVFEIIGDFSGTSLRLNTITIDGDAGDDTIDITSLASAHRIVFRSNGGNDTIIGTLRPQDVVELPDGTSVEDYESTTDENGVTTLTNGEHTITFVAPDGPPRIGDDDDDDDGHPEEEEDEGEVTNPPEGTPAAPIVGTAAADILIGTAGTDELIALGGDDVVIGFAGADVIIGGSGKDFLNGWAGRDIIFAGDDDDTAFGGADADLLYGEAGVDRLFGDEGDDLIHAGSGDDMVVAGVGNDRIVAGVGDGDDVYFGDEIGGGPGIDTLDMSLLTAASTVDLGTGLGGRGSAHSTQSGQDTLWGIENVLTGSGADTIVAGNATNVMDGGAGNDSFVFRSVEAANDDTIVGFEPGDRIDLTAIDANTGTAGNASFTLVAGPAAAGQISVIHETRVDGDYTVIEGNVDADGIPEFRISLRGSHNLTDSDFNL